MENNGNSKQKKTTKKLKIYRQTNLRNINIKLEQNLVLIWQMLSERSNPHVYINLL